jgi:hypothetical protein
LSGVNFPLSWELEFHSFHCSDTKSKWEITSQDGKKHDKD